MRQAWGCVHCSLVRHGQKCDAACSLLWPLLPCSALFDLVLLLLLRALVYPPLCSAEQLLVWGWRVPFLVASVSLGAGVILRYNMPESVEFSSNHDELDQEYHRRLQQQQQTKQHHMHLTADAQQHQLTAAGAETGLSATGKAKDTDAAAAAVLSSEASAGSEKTEDGWVDEAGSARDGDAAVASRHYVPLLELFRGYWSGLVLHVAYAACK